MKLLSLIFIVFLLFSCFPSTDANPKDDREDVQDTVTNRDTITNTDTASYRITGTDRVIRKLVTAHNTDGSISELECFQNNQLEYDLLPICKGLTTGTDTIRDLRDSIYHLWLPKRESTWVIYCI